MDPLTALRQKYPWPVNMPNVAVNQHGWFEPENRAVLARAIIKREAKVILELGSWLGLSTRYMADVAGAGSTVIAADHWKGSSEHAGNPILPILYETFVRNCWDRHRNIIIPMRTDTLSAMQELSDLGVKPDVIYVDASHETDPVAADVGMAMKLWPEATIVGDDWPWPTVKAGVLAAMVGSPRTLVQHQLCYEILPV